MKRLGNLFEKIISQNNLHKAAWKVLSKRHTSPRCALFYREYETHVLQLRSDLVSGLYAPNHYTMFEINDPKHRQICCSSLQDRVVHHAIFLIIENFLDQRYIFDSYACRKGKGLHAAIGRAQGFCRTSRFSLKLDIKKHFENIDHQVLLSILTKLIKDHKLIKLLEKIIGNNPPFHQPGKGLPIGSLTSQHFANLYLNEMDQFCKHVLKTKKYIRYMDDIIIFSDCKSTLWEFHYEIKNYVEKKLHLELKKSATKLSSCEDGVSFLGHRIFPGLIRLNRKKLVKMRSRWSLLEEQFSHGYIDENMYSESLRGIFSAISVGNTLKLRLSMLEKSMAQ